MTRGTPAFDLLKRVVEAHEARIGSDQVSVIPVLVDDLTPLLPLLRGVSTYLGGELYDTTAEDMAEPVVGDLDLTLKATVEATLVLRRPAGDLSVEVVKLPDGRIDARFAGKSGGSAGGERQVLGLARALFATSMRGSEVAILTYDETQGMDRVAQRACWEFLSALRGLRIGSLRSLIVVVGVGSIDYPRHCARSTGFHFGLLGGDLVRRRTDDDVQTSIAETLALASPHAVLFLGAGASASSGLPLGNSLRDNTIRRLLRSDTANSTELCREFRTFLDNQDHLLTAREKGLSVERFVAELTLEQVVRVEKSLRDEPVQTLEDFAELNARATRNIGRSVLAIRRMAAVAKRRLVVVEVNFDTLLECDDPSLFQKFSTDDEFAGSGESPSAVEYIGSYLAGTVHKVPLLKVHGTIENRSSCVASIEQTANGLPKAKQDALMALVGAGKKRVPWLYVGASMRDRDLTSSVFHRQEFAEGVRESWVSPTVPATVSAFVDENREHTWPRGETLHSRSVTELADVFLDALADAWVG